MLPEISLGILDIAENSIAAGATLISIRIKENSGEGILEAEISDNGCGMDNDMAREAADPFCTSRTTRGVGLGIPFFKQAAECTGGEFSLESTPGEGTSVKALFCTNHIDCMPLGDIDSTIESLIVMNPGIDFVYEYERDGDVVLLDTRG